MSILIEVASPDYEPGDPGWLSQVARLYDDIRFAGGEVSTADPAPRRPDGPRNKGVESAAAIALAASAITAVASVIKAWLHERRSTMVVTVVKGVERQSVRVEGPVSEERLIEIFRNAIGPDGGSGS